MMWVLLILAFVLLWVFGGSRARRVMVLAGLVIVAAWVLVHLDTVRSGVETVQRVGAVAQMLGVGW